MALTVYQVAIQHPHRSHSLAFSSIACHPAQNTHTCMCSHIPCHSNTTTTQPAGTQYLHTPQKEIEINGLPEGMRRGCGRMCMETSFRIAFTHAEHQHTDIAETMRKNAAASAAATDNGRQTQNMYLVHPPAAAQHLQACVPVIDGIWIRAS